MTTCEITPEARLTGVLLGTAIGDALGLVTEGMSARAIARRFGRVTDYGLLWPFRVGIVSDDTELSLLIARCLILHPDDPIACARAFRRALVGWCARLPWGVGRATLTAGLKGALGLTTTGVMSAGNGAAMRAAVIGVRFADQPDARLAFGRALANVTHRDPRAVEGALYVAELAAAMCQAPAHDADTSFPRAMAFQAARSVVTHPVLANALDQGWALAEQGKDPLTAAEACGTTGYVVHTLAFATYVWHRYGPDTETALITTASTGGDTDTIGAIVGAWHGARHGPQTFPTRWVEPLTRGPLGRRQIEALGPLLALGAGAGAGSTSARPALPRYSLSLALVRNLALYPIILAQALRRLVPL